MSRADSVKPPLGSLAGVALLAMLLAPWAAQAAADDPADAAAEDDRPIRARRRFLVATEVGWNGLGGLGLVVGWSPHPSVSLDAAGGGGTCGARLGLRARWNLLSRPVTPLLGVGGTYDFGIQGYRSVQATFAPSLPTDFDESAFDGVVNAHQGFGLHAVGGLTFTSATGLTLLATGGFLYRPPDPLLQPPLAASAVHFSNDYAFAPGSGPILAVAIGHAF